MALDTPTTPPGPSPLPLPPPPSRRGRPPSGTAPQRVHRRWGRFAAGATLALLGALASAGLYLSAGNRVAVVALAEDVDQLDKIERDDLRTVRVAVDPTIDTIAGDRIDDLIGRYTAVDLREGMLLAPNQLVSEDAAVVQPGELKVGAELDPGDFPPDLTGGTRVQVVIHPEQGGSGSEPRAVPGWVLDVGEAEEDTGKLSIVIVVAADAAPDVTTASSDDRLSLAAYGD